MEILTSSSLISFRQRGIVFWQEVLARLKEMARFLCILGLLVLLFVENHGKRRVERERERDSSIVYVDCRRCKDRVVFGGLQLEIVA